MTALAVDELGPALVPADRAGPRAVRDSMPERSVALGGTPAQADVVETNRAARR
ncbi:hypothetical protein [Streptomyces guryensis]|uniref:Uncharacterized protein n=1 Tax=Streptomyces guryensis TaxID=2886947 RepID=A0A9Q3VYL4_9ACTN|nr:hypothetical protein [Streptomyces guryensis]MCD9879994.1 hypothetical protein [Streptomyces guryensis]